MRQHYLPLIESPCEVFEEGRGEVRSGCIIFIAVGLPEYKLAQVRILIEELKLGQRMTGIVTSPVAIDQIQQTKISK